MRLRDWPAHIYRVTWQNEEASWVSHFLVCSGAWTSSAALSGWLWGVLVGAVVGFLVAWGLAIWFWRREVQHWKQHAQDQDMPSYKRDGVGDSMGPLIVAMVATLTLLWALR